MNNGQYDRALNTLLDYLSIHLKDMNLIQRIQFKKDIDEYFERVVGIKTNKGQKSERI